MNIAERLRILCKKLDISESELTQAATKISNAYEDKDYFPKRTKIRSCFRTVRSTSTGPKPDVGAREECEAPLADLFLLACKDLGIPDGFNHENLRLDSDPSCFLKELQPSYGELYEALSDHGQSLVDYLEEYSIPKHYFLPASAVIRNSEVPERFPDLFSDFELFRVASSNQGKRSLCIERVSFDRKTRPILTYRDVWRKEYLGFAFLSPDKLISTLHCAGNPHEGVQSSAITIFETDIGDEEFFAIIKRFDFGEGLVHVYRAICKKRTHSDGQVPIVRAAGFNDTRQLRYYYLLDNTINSLESNSSVTTFQTSIKSAREALGKGRKLEEKFADLSDGDRDDLKEMTIDEIVNFLTAA